MSERDTPAAGPADERVEKAMRSPRDLTGFWGKAIMVLGVAFAAYFIFTAYAGLTSPQAHRGFYWGFAGVMVFLLYPARRGSKGGSVPVWDLALAGAVAACAGYFVVMYPELVNRRWDLESYEVGLAIAAAALSLEMTRRTVGWVLAVCGMLAIGYFFGGPYMPGLLEHRGYGMDRFASTMYTSFDGVFGVVTDIFATYVFLFIIFGAVLKMSGAAQFLVDLPFAIAGRSRGGPAKVAVLVSALLGSISGSSVANVMTSGTFTIPLMKRVGY